LLVGAGSVGSAAAYVASFAEATKAAVAEASKTLRHMDWFEVVQERGRIVEGKVEEFQVALKVGFKIER
jgi:dodecin